MTSLSGLGAHLGTHAFLLPALLAVLFSGMLRGFTGFGSALFSVPILSLMFKPAEVAPVVMGLQVLSGLQTLRTDWRQVDGKSMVPLCVTGSIFSVVGAALLVNLSVDVVKLAMGLIVLAAVVLLALGYRFARAPGSLLTSAVGAVSGLLNGFSAMGGPPLIVYFLGGPFSPHAARATMTCIFMVQGAVSLLSVAWLGKVTVFTLVSTLLLFPVLAVGTTLGSRAFRRATLGVYRGVAIMTLTVLALLLLANSAIKG